MNKNPTLVLHLVTTVFTKPQATINRNFLFAVTDYYYQHCISGARATSVELMFKNHARYAYFYVMRTLEGRRWIEAEPSIMKNPVYAYLYARDVIKGKWPEAEPYIITNHKIAFEYAIYAIKGRWPVIEQQMIKWPYFWKIYGEIIEQNTCE